MKVIVFGGYARSLLNFRGPLIKALVERGHQVVGVAPEADDTVRHTLGAWGVPYRSVAMQRNRLDPIGDLCSLLSLRRLFKEVRPDLVLSYTMKPVVYGSIAAASMGAASASIITGLGNTFGDGETTRHRLVRGTLEVLLRFALQTNGRVFFQNRDDLELFAQRKLVRPARAVLVDGTGVDLTLFASPSPPAHPPVFVMLSRLLRQKGVAEFAAAASRLKQRYKHARFWLLGEYESGTDGVSKQEIAHWVEDGALEYFGAVDDVRPYLARSTAVVLPSYYREGIPRSLQEGLATGRAIVTTDTPGCRETVKAGTNGYLVPPKDVDALAGAFEDLIRYPQKAIAFGHASRLLAETRFDVRIINARILEAIGAA